MDASAMTPSQRANDLLSRMSTREKTQQLSAVMPHMLLGREGLSSPAMEHHLGLGIGHVSGVAGFSSPSEIAQKVNGIQRYLVEHTRLGIPAIVHNEALNGFVAAGYTSFPTAIALAATWDPEGVEDMAQIIRRQMRSVGVLQALSPVLDVARDARWGRVHETYGEDPYLVSALGVAYVQGLQGNNLLEGVIATAKHFLGYALTEAGQNQAVTHLGSRELYDVYAAPFEAAVRLAGLQSVMNSYSEIDGVPVGASRAILTDLLRGRLGFDGTVVADYSAVEWLHTRQRVASSPQDAGILALEAGLDIELPSVVSFGPVLEEAVAAGRVQREVLDDAVRRVLISKAKLGLFENPYVTEEPIVLRAISSEGRDLSRRLADESVTLLKNDGILPIASGTKRIAVIGPHADSAIVNFAAYTHPAHLDMVKALMTGQSTMAGIESMAEIPAELKEQMAAEAAKLAALDTDALVRHEHDTADLAQAVREAMPQANVQAVRGVGVLEDDPQDIESAVAAAREADLVVLAIGGRAGWFAHRITEGEATDAADVSLSRPQVELVRAVAATGTPCVGVVYQGRPYGLADVDDLLSALLIAYYPGPYGPRAIASVLAGLTNPSGKLPYTLPRATGQVPIYAGQKHGSGYRRGDVEQYRGYVDLPTTPLYCFGHGLSYTSFEYGDLKPSRTQVTGDDHLTMTLTVSNTGQRAGTEVVQLYASVTAPRLTRPAQQLIGFARVDLAPQAAASVTFDVAMAQLGYSGVDGRFVLEPGPVDFVAGSSSEDLRSRTRIEVIGDPVDLEGRRAFLSSVTVAEAELQDARG